MLNRYGINLAKTVFVVDSPITAFMVSILSEGKPVTLVLEKKEGLETENASDLLVNFVNSCICIETIKIINLPHRFYVGGKDIKQIWNIRQKTRDIYDEYNCDTVFVGASTSTFMRCLRCDSKNIVYLHHGLTDLIRREDECVSRQTLKGRLKKIFIGKLLGMPYSTWCNFWPDRAFSLCKLKSQNEKWLNIFDFKSDIIKTRLKFLNKYEDLKKNVLFFPVSEGHTKTGVNSDVTSFDQFNFEFLSRHIDPAQDRVFVKYHPWIYRANDNTKSNLLELLEQSGIEAYDISEMIPEDIGGVLLPTEVICRYAKIDKMISRETSTMWYLSGDNKIEKIIDITSAPKEYHNLMIHCINQLKIKSYTDDIRFYI